MRERTTSLLLALGVLLASGACERSSPTDPRPDPEPVQVLISDPAGQFAAHHGAIRDLLLSAAATARTAIPIDPIRFEVFVDRPRVIPGYGIGGYTVGPTSIEIVIDPTYAGLGEVLPRRLPPLAAHELHHAVRWRGPGPPPTLLEALVFEGLADRFAVELMGAPVPPWCLAFPESETADYLALARPEFDDSGFNFGAWFFGIGTSLPRWTGYTLGFHLVGAYQARTGRSAAQLVHTPAEEFRPD